MSKHFVDAQGNYLGAFVGPTDKPDAIEPPEGGVEVPTAPPDGRSKWDGLAWGPPPPPPPPPRDLAAELDVLKTKVAATEAEIEQLKARP